MQRFFIFSFFVWAFSFVLLYHFDKWKLSMVRKVFYSLGIAVASGAVTAAVIIGIVLFG